MNLLPQRLACTALLLAALSGHAGFDAFLKIEGIPGEAEGKSKDHKEWIEVLSVVSSLQPGGPMTPAVTTLAFTKFTDKASPVLFERCAAGTPVPWARLELVQTNPAVVRFFDIRMSNVVITAASVMQSVENPDPRPTESLSLNFTKIEWTYTTVRAGSRLPRELRSASLDAATGIATGATNAAVFTVTGIQRIPGAVELNWPAVAGRTYDVYACHSLTGSFSFQGQLTATADGPMTHTAPLQPGTMFYAVEERP